MIQPRSFLTWRLSLTAMAVAAISLVLASSALATTTTIDTTPNWIQAGGLSIGGVFYDGPYVFPFGNPYDATYGQIVTVPPTDAKLDSFTFYMRQPTGVKFRGEVYAWNNSSQRATGPALYESGQMHTTNSGIFQPITFPTGGINVTAGKQYVLFASVSKDYNLSYGLPGGSWAAIHSLVPAVPAAGPFVYMNNGSDTSQWTGGPNGNTPWTVSNYTLAFKASFSSDNDLTLAQPSNVTVDATSRAGAAVTYTTPKATDESLTSVSVSCLPASGSTFAIGDTTVTCTAIDTGDTNSGVQQSFNVHVKGAAEQLADLANAVQGVGPGQSLANDVASAQSLLAANHVHGACGTLNDFIGVSTAQGLSTLAAAAQQIEAVIGC
jgi:hypothetical protein